MDYCRKCGTEYGAANDCMCATYQRRMEQEEYDKVPKDWILGNWDGGQLYCHDCKSQYWPSEDCDCAVYRVWKAYGREDSIPDWWHDSQSGNS